MWQGGLMDQMCPVLPKLLFDMWKAKSVPHGFRMMDSGKSSSQIFNSGESCSISSLPFEIVELILSFLSKPSAQLAASQVSPIFYQIQVNHCLMCTLGRIILLLFLTLVWLWLMRIVTFYWTQIRSKSTILSFLSKPSSQLAASQVLPTFYQAQVQSFCTHSSLGQLWLKFCQDFEA